jgi:hypothetical protein
MGCQQQKNTTPPQPEKERKNVLFQFQIGDAIKAAKIEATEAYNPYVEEPKTSQRRGRFDLELELVT